jgi:hypothetical protein
LRFFHRGFFTRALLLCSLALLTACGPRQEPAPTTPTPAAPVATTASLATAPQTSSSATSTPLPPKPALPPQLPLPSASPQAATAPAGATTLFLDAALRASVDNARALAALGGDAVKAHQLLNQLTAPPEPERAYARLRWCERQGWPDRGTTVTAVKALLAGNAANRALVYKLAEADAFAWPAPLDANTVVPNFVNMQTIGLLVLAHARYGLPAPAATSPRHPPAAASRADEALRDIKAVMMLGRRLQGPNATVLAALNGLELRQHALQSLAWYLQHDPDSIRRPGECALFLAREQQAGAGALQRAWEHQTRAAEHFMQSCFSLLQREITARPPLKSQLRLELIQKGALPDRAIDNDELLDFISTRTLHKYYRRYVELGQEFARNTPAARLAHRSEYQKNLKDIYKPWARRLDPFPADDMDDLLFQEDRVIAQGQLLINALAVLAGARPGKPLKKPTDYLTALAIDPKFATDPFTAQPYKLKEVRRTRVSIQGADRRELIFMGVPDVVIQSSWINKARPVLLELRATGGTEAKAAAPTPTASPKAAPRKTKSHPARHRPADADAE